MNVKDLHLEPWDEGRPQTSAPWSKRRPCPPWMFNWNAGPPVFVCFRRERSPNEDVRISATQDLLEGRGRPCGATCRPEASRAKLIPRMTETCVQSASAFLRCFPCKSSQRQILVRKWRLLSLIFRTWKVFTLFTKKILSLKEKFFLKARKSLKLGFSGRQH